jgi:NADH dehydrogenase [ubiquinone] 1 alpha subcomplex assembly factor 5
MPSPNQLFDRLLVRRRRERAAASLAGADFLVTEVVARLAERVQDVRRHFPLGLALGAHGGRLAAALAGCSIGSLVQADHSRAMLAGCTGPVVVADEEALPFGMDRFDLVVSAQVLHWVNDLPGTLAQLRYCLKPDGLLLLALPGGETLTELRASLLDAELEVEGGAGPRVSPFLELRDAAALLQRASFALPVADIDRLTVSYPDPLALLRDLRAMGETNALVQRRHGLRRATLARALELYAERHADAAGRVGATFDIVFLTAWKPHESQPKPLARGSGRVDLAAALGSQPAPGGRTTS